MESLMPSVQLLVHKEIKYLIYCDKIVAGMHFLHLCKQLKQDYFQGYRGGFTCEGYSGPQLVN